MRTEAIKIYTFEELTETAKKKAIENLRDINTDHEWYEFTIDDWKEKLAAIGFENARIMFSGFCSQGDGACFELEGNSKGNAKKIIDNLTKAGAAKYKKLRKISDYICIEIFRNSFGNHYSHARTRYALTSLDSARHYPRIEKLIDDLGEAIEALRLDLSEEIYADLTQEYEYLTSDEAIKETIESNGYEFTELGKRY